MANNWRSQSFRDNIVDKLNDHIRALDVPLRNDARQMETNIFQKARSEHEYMAYIARLMVYIRDKSRNDAAAAAAAAAASAKPAIATESIARSELIDEESELEDPFEPAASNSHPVAQTPPPPPPPPPPSSSCAPAPIASITNNSNAFSQRRIEPNASQKFEISKTAIATVLQNPNWRCDPNLIRPQVQLFGQYVAAQLSQIDDEELLVITQQKVIALLNKAI